MKRILFVITLVAAVLISGCKKKETYTVVFNANGGDGTMAAQTFTEGESQALTANAFTRDGYTFSGWNTLIDGTGTSYADQQTITVTENMTLYAQWEAEASTIRIVSFDANGGTGSMQSQSFEVGVSQALQANSFTRTDFTFKGWNTEFNGTGASYVDQQVITVNENMTLYAQWIAEGATTYIVAFDANGGEGTMPNQIFEEGVPQQLTENSFTRQGYVFAGWNTAVDGSGTSYVNQQTIIINTTLILYAQWNSVTGTLNGHTWIDLGLSSGTKWATCNVGATTPESYGNYYAWGETTTKTTYDWSTYIYANGNWNSLTKYCNNPNYGNNGFSDTLTVLQPNDDAATVNWGSGWRMPSKIELQELLENCTITWTTQNGVNGRLFTGPNSNSIFLPAAGYYMNGSTLNNVGSSSNYWSRTLYTDYPGDAWYVNFSSSNCNIGNYYRSIGCSVRPVCTVQN